MNEGRKDDQYKAPWHLLPLDAIDSILKVLSYGAKKYSPRNWELGMDWDRPYSALLRHMSAWYQGEKLDPETNLPHLAHAGCCILFLLAYELRNVGTDSRPILDKISAQSKGEDQWQPPQAQPNPSPMETTEQPKETAAEQWNEAKKLPPDHPLRPFPLKRN